MSKLIVANWKLHPLTEREAARLARASDHTNVVVCPPFPLLPAVRKVLKKAALGAQDAFWETEGPYTGEVSPVMLKKYGVSYVILGHSERRRWFGETDALIAKKVRAALYAGLRVILCVGEPLAVRRRGLAAAKQFVAAQLKKDLAVVSRTLLVRSSLAIAYEPLWAIGTGRADDPRESAAMTQFIKSKVKSQKLRVLYGGSVTSANVKRILSHRDIDGALVGGASVKQSEFKKIITNIF